MRHYLQALCDEFGVSLVMSELDICPDPAMDLLDESIAERGLQEVLAKQWDVVLVTPPCAMLLRVCFVQPGPKPLRSRLYLLGFPWLSNELPEQASQEMLR